jgi:tetratricopeptide (TPR) repeat protein
MTTKSRIPVSGLLLLAAASLSAQSVKIDVPAEIPEHKISPESVQESQVIPVADEGIEDNADFSEPEATEVEMLLSEFELFKQLMQDRIFDEADSVAKRVVEMAIRLKGPQSTDTAKALTNLAIVQHQTGQYDAAQQNFESAIEIIEDNEDRLNAQLVNPLKGLGASQLESGRPDLATVTFRRAVHVTHVNEGPHNIYQVDLLESIAESYLRMGDVDSAKQAQDRIHALNIRKYELDTLALVPALMRRAAWQHRAGFIYDERTTYRRVIRIIEENADKNDLQLVAPLIMLGKSFFYLDTSGTQSFSGGRTSTGEIYFRRAVRIAAEHPDTNWQVIAQATLALGDHYMYNNNAQRGRAVYQTAWNLLSEDEARFDVRREQLEEIVTLKQRRLPQYINPSDEKGSSLSDDPLLQGKVAMTYEVTTSGRAANVKMVEAQPAEFTDMQHRVQREVRRRIYRPRFEDAEAVSSPDQLLVHTFFYRPSDLEAAKAAMTADNE